MGPPKRGPTQVAWRKSTHPGRPVPRIGVHDDENGYGRAPQDPLRGGCGDHRAGVRTATRARRGGPPARNVAAPAPARVRGDRRDELQDLRRACADAEGARSAEGGPAAGTGGRQQRRLPAASAVREDLPPPPWRAAVELPQPGWQLQWQRPEHCDAVATRRSADRAASAWIRIPRREA